MGAEELTMPAPAGNDNASSTGLYAKHPTHNVVVPVDAPPSELATLARDLGDGALWIAERLAAEVEHITVDGGKAQKLIGLYAAVAHELQQLAAELEGVTGIKASPLGQLSAKRYVEINTKQTQALSLILSQCRTAWVRLQDRVTVLAAGEAEEEEGRKRALVELDGSAFPVLNYLATHMRVAKRMMRDLASNRAWQKRGEDDDSDLTALVMKDIENG